MSTDLSMRPLIQVPTSTSERSRCSRTAKYSSLDSLPGWAAEDSVRPDATSGVVSVAVQPDGKILVGGNFTTLGGGGFGTATRDHIGRLNPDGSLDASFDPGANGSVSSLALQADGRILVGGGFHWLAAR